MSVQPVVEKKVRAQQMVLPYARKYVDYCRRKNLDGVEATAARPTMPSQARIR
jgi:alpha-glucosidase (family GH31 glycosyl hydrolase)